MRHRAIQGKKSNTVIKGNGQTSWMSEFLTANFSWLIYIIVHKKNKGGLPNFPASIFKLEKCPNELDLLYKTVVNIFFR
jgi:hypothetical protein